jgi:hypothetical protein
MKQKAERVRQGLEERMKQKAEEDRLHFIALQEEP